MTNHADITDPLDLHEPKPHAITHNSVELLGAQDPLSLDAEQITSGLILPARMGSGTPSVNTYLRGDQTWVVAPSGSGNFPAMDSNRYFDTSAWLSTTQVSNLALSANTLYGVPVLIPGSYSFDAIVCNVSASGGVGSMLRMGIYSAGVTGLPGTLVKDAGEIAASTTGERSIAISPASDLTEGFYWVVLVSSGTPTVYGHSAATRGILGNSAAGSTTNMFAVSRSLTYAALPDPFGASTIGSSGPKIALVTV